MNSPAAALLRLGDVLIAAAGGGRGYRRAVGGSSSSILAVMCSELDDEGATSAERNGLIRGISTGLRAGRASSSTKARVPTVGIRKLGCSRQPRGVAVA
jgi:hypothetical protein